MRNIQANKENTNCFIFISAIPNNAGKVEVVGSVKRMEAADAGRAYANTETITVVASAAYGRIPGKKREISGIREWAGGSLGTAPL